MGVPILDVSDMPLPKQVHVGDSGVVRLLECGPACCCGQDCAARTTQQGLSVKVTLKWSDAKVCDFCCAGGGGP